MNEKLEQAKDKIAQGYGYNDWKGLEYHYQIMLKSFIPKAIWNQVAERYHELMESSVNERFDEITKYDLSEITEDIKDEFIDTYIKTTGEMGMRIFMMFGLTNKIEAMMINDANKDEFIFSFKKLPTKPKQ